MAGSAILRAPEMSEKIDTVTLTINNACNLRCPHCYLQYNSKAKIISEDVLEKVFDSDFRHLAIVGKEPSVNPEIVRSIAKRIDESGRTISIITNGTMMQRFDPEVFQLLSYIDISFDGGPVTYSRSIIGFERIIEGLRFAKTNGCDKFVALHTLYKENLSNILDTIKVSDCFDFDYVLFSPYLVSRNHGTNNTGKLSLTSDILPRLAEEKLFLEELETRLLISGLHLHADEISSEFLIREIEKFGLSKKVLIFDQDPILKGFIRVNYDGIVLTPFESLHPEDYRKSKFSLYDDYSLEDIFCTMRNDKKIVKRY